MEQLISIKDPQQLERMEAPSCLSPFDPEHLVRHAPDAHWIAVRDDGEMVGRCSLWWRSTPYYPGHRPGLIGHYAARDGTVGRHLLSHACKQLGVRGCTLAVGPIDGNTWRRYRLITERGTEPAFFLEPDNPDEWPEHFTGSGFTALARYMSSIDSPLSLPDPRLAEVAARTAARGIRIRSLNIDRFEEELHRIHTISLASFCHNFLYSPIGEAEFISQYRPLQPFIQPELMLIAEQQSRPIAFLFALPDLLRAKVAPEQLGKSEKPIDTFIIKTVAVRPDHRTAGLGSLLVAHCQEAARTLGYRQAIHALMHEANDSRKISGHYGGQTMRRYALFGKAL